MIWKSNSFDKSQSPLFFWFNDKEKQERIWFNIGSQVSCLNTIFNSDKITYQKTTSRLKEHPRLDLHIVNSNFDISWKQKLNSTNLI